MASQRLAQEFRSFNRATSKGTLPGVDKLSLVDDNLAVWRFHIRSAAFDQDLPQTKKLKQDLRQIFIAYDHPEALIMEAR